MPDLPDGLRPLLVGHNIRHLILGSAHQQHDDPLRQSGTLRCQVQMDLMALAGLRPHQPRLHQLVYGGVDGLLGRGAPLADVLLPAAFTQLADGIHDHQTAVGQTHSDGGLVI